MCAQLASQHRAAASVSGLHGRRGGLSAALSAVDPNWPVPSLCSAFSQPQSFCFLIAAAYVQLFLLPCRCSLYACFSFMPCSFLPDSLCAFRFPWQELDWPSCCGIYSYLLSLQVLCKEISRSKDEYMTLCLPSRSLGPTARPGQQSTLGTAVPPASHRDSAGHSHSLTYKFIFSQHVSDLSDFIYCAYIGNLETLISS